MTAADQILQQNAFWLVVLAGVAALGLVALGVVDWLAKRDAHAQELRDEARRQAHLDAIVRGRDGLR